MVQFLTTAVMIGLAILIVSSVIRWMGNSNVFAFVWGIGCTVLSFWMIGQAYLPFFFGGQ